MKNGFYLRKGAAWLTAFLFVLTVLTVPVSALAGGVSRSSDSEAERLGDEPMGARAVVESHDPPPVDTDFSTIRVLITTGSSTTLWLDLYGQYTISGASGTFSSSSGTPYPLAIVRYNSSSVIVKNRVTDDIISYGPSVTVTRVNQLYEAGFAKLTKSGSSHTLDRMYLGDFTFRIGSDGYIAMVNTVPLAYYLYGVVGYEMAPGCEDHALYAQAIVAKSFALYYVDVSASSTWDVQDGFKSATYQGYRGFRENRLATMPHCLAVVGEAIVCEGQFVPTCYAHSDGGETALPSHVFGSSRFDYAYSVSIDDIEFDNDDDTKRVIHVDFGGTGNNSRFRDFILTKINAAYGVGANLVKEIKELYCFDPVEGTERNMQRLHFKAKVRTADGSNHTYTIECPTMDLKEYRISDVDGSGDSYSSSKTVFSENFLIFWGRETGEDEEGAPTGYEVYFARYGHGLGLSQIGANTRANEVYNQTYQEILEFYFPKFDLISIQERNPDGTGGEIVAPPEVVAYGECTGNNVNFRDAPNTTDSNILGKVQRTEHLDILDCTSDGWYKAIWRGMTGYINMEYSRITMFPSPADGVFMLRDGVTLTAANLRYEPYVDPRNKITKLPAGTRITSWAQINKWHYVTTENGYQGFISGNVTSYGDPYPYTGSSSIQLRIPPYQLYYYASKRGKWD